MKQNLKNSVILGTFGVAMMAASGGCSDEETGGFNGFGNNGNSTAGTSSTAGAFSNGGTNSPGTAGTSPGTSGAVGVAGTSFGMAGTPSTAGAGAGGAGAGGAGGAGTAGTAGAGTAGAGTAGTGGGGSCPAPTGVHTGTAFASSCFTITASHCANTNDNKDPPANALDGDAMTRWSTGGAMDTARKYTFTIDLGAAVMVSGVMATTKAGSGDVPPEVEIALASNAAGPFTPVACATGVTDALDAGFAATSAQFVRLTQVGTKTPNWWSIAEVSVYGSGTCGTGGTHVCTTSVTQ